MLKTLLGIILALGITAPAAPTLSYNEANHQFTATFPAGAEWAAVTYHSLTETIEQEGKTVPYEFHYADGVALDETEVTFGWLSANCYIDSKTDECPSGGDWDIFIELQYPNPPDANGVYTFTDTKSNTIRVRH